MTMHFGWAVLGDREVAEVLVPVVVAAVAQRREFCFSGMYRPAGGYTGYTKMVTCLIEIGWNLEIW